MLSKIFIKTLIIGVILLIMYLLYISTIDMRSFYPSDLVKMQYISQFDWKESSQFQTHHTDTEDQGKITHVTTKTSDYQGNLKYILLWTASNTVPFMFMGEGRSGFIKRNCTFTNCYVTDDRHYLGYYSNFDVIAFAGPQLRDYDLPRARSPHQKYAFVSIESPAYYPICELVFDNFFNWTWTYKLDSDSRWGYLVIKNRTGEVIGPNKDMHWIKLKDMDPVEPKIWDIIKNKTKAAAWFVSNCNTNSKREKIAFKLKEELKKYNHTLDIYGECGSLQCPRNTAHKCNRMLKNEYFFYLSFENSFGEDYVTEKLLYPLQHYAVPIVYGSANYTRFMPDGIYLDVRSFEVPKLALEMQRLIKNLDEYAELFRWKKHYTYHYKSDSPVTDDYCRICALLNDEKKVKSYSTYKHFRKWWNIKGTCQLYRGA